MSDYRASKATIKIEGKTVARCVGSSPFDNEDNASMFARMLNEHGALMRRSMQLEIALRRVAAGEPLGPAQELLVELDTAAERR